MAKERKEKTAGEKQLTMARMRTGTHRTSQIRVRKIISGEESDTTQVMFPALHVKATNLKYWDVNKDTNMNSIEVGKHYLDDLAWEDKEAVLRSLFAQMNGKQQLLHHSTRGHRREHHPAHVTEDPHDFIHSTLLPTLTTTTSVYDDDDDDE
jgi:hypothetical protein